jgi:hypothetical protein
MHVNPDDDGRTREDREVERKEGDRGVWVKLTR